MLYINILNNKNAMRNTVLLSLLYIFIFTSDFIHARDIEFPNVRHSSQSNVIIKRVQTFETQTIIDFVYKSNESYGRYIFLSPPKSNDAMYIKIRDSKYKLLYTIGIGDKDGTTYCNPRQEVKFTAVFDAIPQNASEFDLIEGKSGSWNFYGVQLEKEESNQIDLCRLKIFRIYENEKDITSSGDPKAYIILYLDNGNLCLANVHPSHGSQSWGSLVVEDSEIVKADDGNTNTFYYAKWYYQNSYDNNSGIALVAIGQQGYTDKAIVQISANENVMLYITNVRGNLEKVLYDDYKRNSTSKSNRPSSTNKTKQKTLRKNPNFKIE